MEKIFDNPSKLEALVKTKFAFPDFIMMENAALAIKELLLKLPGSTCLILCGKGNNGGDGYALARLIYKNLNPILFCLEPPATPQAIAQHTMCKKLGIPFINKKQLTQLLEQNSADFIIDCLYGTGFKGQLAPQVKKFIDAANKSKAIRVACDISSALEFNADYTVTMGEYKLSLFSDKAKAVSGQIIVAELGMPPELFQNEMEPAAYLITDQDCHLPLRTNKAAHKGTFGHTAVIAGKKAGASIICASAAMNFGCALTTLVQTQDASLKQFKIPPELMLNNAIPSKATSVVYGPGTAPQDLNLELLKNIKIPAVVFDAGVFGSPEFCDLLKQLDSRPGSRIVLTPHLLELTRLCKSLKLKPEPSVQELADDVGQKIQLGRKINKLFPNTVLVIKSANTFIAANGRTYIITDGSPSLAKGGSGDVLAGMIASLLAQGYSAQDAAITACEAHALASKKIGARSYDLTPQKLIKAVSSLN
ncbi:MAG: NAD(P)H-hydrate dehydratase [Treponema sp.]|nr:NAD(P)H-hydrate dehydratase [Treponema sp.]